MWIEHVFLGICGLTAGLAAASGTFAFMIMIGVLPRLIGKSRTAGEVLVYENIVIVGGLVGNVLSVFPQLPIPIGRWFLSVYGLGAGVYVGCLGVALAEILQTFPIIFRRLKIKRGLPVVLTAMAVGKLCGALLYFMSGYTRH